jgi:hypothetical protein
MCEAQHFPDTLRFLAQGDNGSVACVLPSCLNRVYQIPIDADPLLIRQMIVHTPDIGCFPASSSRLVEVLDDARIFRHTRIEEY